MDAEIKAAQERIHRSIGQRVRWAKEAIAERVQRERKDMDYPWHTTMASMYGYPSNMPWMLGILEKAR